MTHESTTHPQTGGYDTIIHIGAGRCSELPQYLAADAARIILIEPQPDRARALRNQVTGQDNVTVIEAAIAGPDADERLKVFNQSDYSSLREPTGLREIFPGLRTKRELDVDRVTPRELIEREALEAGQNHWLVIDVPGEEAAILDELTANEKLAAFARIDLNCGTTSLYENSEPATALLQRLAENGYDAETSDAESDPDRPRWSLRRNTLKLENLDLQTRLAERDDQLAKAEKETKQLKEQLNERARERDEAQEAHEQAKKEAKKRQQERDEAKEQAEKLTNELEQAKATAEQHRKERDEARNAAENEKELRSREAKAREELENRFQEERRKLATRQQELQRAQADESERSEREERMQEELARAEAQIDLIKEFVLREQQP